MFDIEGILAPVFTPMTDTGSLNLDVIPLYTDYLNEHNVTGILVGGTTGEAMSLSVEERKILLEAWMAAAKPLRMKVVAQIGGIPLPNVLDLARHAESLAVDGIMTLPELYYKPKNVDQLLSYLKTVSEAAPTRSLIYYHFPMMSGVDVNMRQLFELASSTIPNFKGAKADLEVAEQVAEQTAKDQRIFIANHHIAPAVLMGHDASIATVSNIFPVLVKDIVNAVKNADVVRANALQKKLNKLVDIITSQGDFVPSMKAAMELVTCLSVGPTRRPLVCLDPDQRTSLKKALSLVK